MHPHPNSYPRDPIAFVYMQPGMLVESFDVARSMFQPCTPKRACTDVVAALRMAGKKAKDELPITIESRYVLE